MREDIEQRLDDWQEIESAPKDGREMLVFCADTREMFVVFWNEKNRGVAVRHSALWIFYLLPPRPMDAATSTTKRSRAMTAITVVPVTRFGQIKAGDFILINDGKFTFPADVKHVIRPGTVDEEVIISRSKNIYFVSHMMLDGTGWAKSVSVVKSGRIFNYSNTMKDYHNDRD